jgi:ABC-type transporter Mla subunit MlaD
MRRVAVIILVLATAGGYVLATTGAREDSSARRYTVEIDNAFGIVKGADLKIAGVRAGQITGLRLDRKSKRALVDFEVTKLGFGSLRTDVFCETRPQSLIGEYFIDCRPGTAAEEWPRGKVIPVSRTASTVPGDLVNNIMRRPERERLRIILNEIGAGIGARGPELNETIRRAVPALRETDKVLAMLARQNQVLAKLTVDADTVITELADNKRDVSRFVRETRQTASASAERRDDIARSFSKLPEFLRELRPTMAELGRAADAQTPTLVDLQASAGQLERLFTQLEPFAEASQANLASLGQAAQAGRPAVQAARPLVGQLGAFAEKAPESAKNARFITEHLDDRGNAVEKDPRSPGGQGYTGFEAILQYLYDQALSINLFDANGYILKANLFHSECSEYQNAESLKKHMQEDPDFYKRCAAILGPHQQGITVPDPTAGRRPAARQAGERRAPRERERRAGGAADTTPAGGGDGGGGGGGGAPQQEPAQPPVDLGETLGGLLDGRVPDLNLGPAQKPLDAAAGGLRKDRPQVDPTVFLDFLFGS